MIVYEEIYGADIDGNRGQLILEYEIEDSDYEYIHDQIIAQLSELDKEDEVPDEMEITLICPYTDDDIQFIVAVKDYL